MKLLKMLTPPVKASVILLVTMVAVSVQAAVSARQYVQRGLVAHWDALENNGYGQYDGTATVWKDLRGNVDLTIVDAEATWEADALLPPQKGHASVAQAAEDAITMSDYQAMEVCADYRSETATVAGLYGRAFSWHKAGFIGWNISATCLASLTAGTAYTVYAYYYPGVADVREHRLDGEVIAADSSVPEQELAADKTRFEVGRSVNAWWSSQAAVHAVRLYAGALTPDEALINSNLDKIRFSGADGTTLAWPASVRFANDEVQFHLASAAAETRSTAPESDNRIAVSGGDASASVEVWSSQGATLTPQPDAAHRYFYWSGDTDGLEIDANGVVVLPVGGTPRSLVCHFVAKDSLAEARTWTGLGEPANWSDAANWAPAGVPAGDDVLTVPAGSAVALGASTPVVSSLIVEGTVTVTNWNACIRATDVRIANGGVLTCTPAFEKEAMGRVWIQCADLTVAAGGKIDVSACGYLSGEKSETACDGYGPGLGAQLGMGAAHGGLGGFVVYSAGTKTILGLKPDFSDVLYDDPAAPVEPGSSGRTSPWNRGGNGGGAVRIAATGRVTVMGSVLASGGSQGNTGLYNGESHGTSGSGGSVYISCQTFAGTNGVIRADGGDGHFTLSRETDASGNLLPSVFGRDYPMDHGDLAGGGGMIAIHYATDRQTADMTKDMTISAEPGHYPNYYCCKGPTRANEDRYDCQADLGTLHFSDGTLVRSLLGNGLSGQILGFDEWVCDDLSFTKGFVRFVGEGFRLKVKGDLTVSGTDVRLDVAGVAMTNRIFRAEVWAGRETMRLEVGGNLTVSDGARVDIRAAETNAVNALGASVTVGKTLTVGKDGWFYAWCDPVCGASPLFSVSNLTVAAGGLLTAEGRGFAGAVGRDNGAGDRYWNHWTGGYGPTRGFTIGSGWPGYTFADGTKISAPATGGSHGGLGGLSSIAEPANVRYAQTGDDLWRPVLPGSGGGAAATSFSTGFGGGVIRVEAADHIQVDGTINADAGMTWARVSAAAGGAGGAILLSSRTFAGAATGVLTARGGDINFVAEADRMQASGAGGGGRIAVWTGEAYPGRTTSSRIGKFEKAADCPGCDFPGTATATGGTNLVATLSVEAGATLNGGDGTVRFAHVGPPQGLLMIVR